MAKRTLQEMVREAQFYGDCVCGKLMDGLGIKRCPENYLKTTKILHESISAQNEALKRWVNEWKQTAERAEALCEAAEQRADRLQAQVFEAQGEITNLQSHLLALGADSYFAMYGWNVVDGKDEAGEPFTIEHAVAAIREEQARGRKASAEAGRLQAELDEMEETWLTTNRARGS